jgi:very-short-patch-repair endonuclease
MENYQGYNKALRPLAHSLRETATKAEACLWKYALRAGQMKGYTFRRQRPVLDYIADFMCHPLMLIIELDGGIHQDDDVAANDATRQQRLEAAGFTLMRFDNDTVLHHMTDVRRQIEAWIEDYEQIQGIPEKAARAKAQRS